MPTRSYTAAHQSPRRTNYKYNNYFRIMELFPNLKQPHPLAVSTSLGMASMAPHHLGARSSIRCISSPRLSHPVERDSFLSCKAGTPARFSALQGRRFIQKRMAPEPVWSPPGGIQCGAVPNPNPQTDPWIIASVQAAELGIVMVLKVLEEAPKPNARGALALRVPAGRCE